MPLQNSGAISLNEIHIEAGGSSGTQASINDADIRGLISKNSATQMSFNEWYGASAVDDATFTGASISYSHNFIQSTYTAVDTVVAEVEGQTDILTSILVAVVLRKTEYWILTEHQDF